jgi:hypothetical protein
MRRTDENIKRAVERESGQRKRRLEEEEKYTKLGNGKHVPALKSIQGFLQNVGKYAALFK